MVSYAFWEEGEPITVTTQVHGFGSDGVTCAISSSGDLDYYQKMDTMHTKRSPWPYNNDSVCAYNYTFTNDDNDKSNDVEIYSDVFDGALSTSSSILVISLATLITDLF